MNNALQIAPLSQRLAQELNIRPAQIEAVMSLLAEGATVPFIARYRKERTGGLDDTQLRTLAERLEYGQDLDKRREAIAASLQAQGVNEAGLWRALSQATTKQELEDLYLPYRPKRQSKAQKALAAGLGAVAERLWQGQAPSSQWLANYINAELGYDSVDAVLAGAEAIIHEQITEQAKVLGPLREWLQRQGWLHARVKRGQASEDSKFRDYFDHGEPLAKVASHRLLAMLRGEREGVLVLTIQAGKEQSWQGQALELLRKSLQQLGWWPARSSAWLEQSCVSCWQERLLPGLGKEVLALKREQAEQDALQVFALNLRDLLLAAPAGGKVVLGLDPGLRTGVKVALVDHTGRVLATQTIYPHAPQKRWDEALAQLQRLCRQQPVELIAVGNGTASRETEALARELAAKLQPQPQVVMVSEAGASVYSASALAAQELAELDVSLRGAVSIARRLQDPLAELVKIDPKAIGVGQYQHDVNQSRLATSLDAVVEDCVNAVGVELNTASPALLARVAGLSPALAEAIVAYRDEQGAFSTRQQLLKVPRLGPKTFQQAAGFLRIREGVEPLDASAVHPEAYAVVAKMAARVKVPVRSLIGNDALLQELRLSEFVEGDIGEYTLKDIVAELRKPGRDPRPEFVSLAFDERVQSLDDLEVGMQLAGVVTNVTDFGAFVDIGVHQDGLVHISQLCERFVSHPREVVQSGQHVQVRVLEVDKARKRISLTMKAEEAAPNRQAATAGQPSKGQSNQGRSHAAVTANTTASTAVESALAQALRGAGMKKSR